MDKWLISEAAYRNGYEQGKKDVVVYAEWKWDGKHYYCSRCAGVRYHDLVLGMDAAYCPYCGAKMLM